MFWCYGAPAKASTIVDDAPALLAGEKGKHHSLKRENGKRNGKPVIYRSRLVVQVPSPRVEEKMEDGVEKQAQGVAGYDSN